MTKLLIVTSLFLVWAMFEMSGGQSFAPGTARTDNAIQESDVLIEKTRLPAVTTVSLEQAVSVEEALTDASYVPFNAPIISHDPQAPSVLLASYAEPVTMTDATLVRDIRRVTGDSVNVRQGAGTQHSVVGKANRGDEAEVLTVDGDWAQVHLISTGETGWMASWLLTE
ncbi:SH3 domain-containing protein [Yoonia maritima]|uniref:SH3 domain-containing protein n=1 Tax=Yoonia maritima TaxID=1435347 RepID=UPI0013A61A4D|nr:SH3 domain-containing protein [Yoonia maritima]